MKTKVNVITNEYCVKESDLEFFKAWYTDYVSSFKVDPLEHNPFGNKDPYEIKKSHTEDVRNVIIEIANILKLNKECIALSEVAALFHDIGRFEQFRIYKTFEDHKSANHGSLACKILNKSKILKILNSLTEKSILSAIAQHNSKNISPYTKEEYLFFVKLLRDADKISLFPFFLKELPSIEKMPIFSVNSEDGGEISDEIYQELITYKKVDKLLIKSPNDFKLFIISWIFDINFQESLEIIIKNQYIEKLFNFLPKNSKTENIKQALKKLKYIFFKL